MDEVAVTAAIDAQNETDIDLPAIEVFTPQEIAARDTQVKKQALAEGGTAAIEMLVKEKKKELGLEFEGKDVGKLLEAYQTKVLADAKLVPDEALKKKDDIINGLRANISTLEKEKTDAISQAAKIKQETAIKASIPTNLSGVEPDEVLASMRLKGYDFVEEDGKIVAKKDGQIVADKALQPLALADVIKGYATERKWLADEQQQRAGRGGGSSKKPLPNGSKPTTLSQAEEAWVADGKSAGTADYQRYVDGLMSENKDFDLNA